MKPSGSDLNIRYLSVCSEQLSPRQLANVNDFCQKAELESKLPSQNWSTQAWQNNPASLLYLLHIEKRFSFGLGEISLLYYNDELVSLSGVYASDFAPQSIAIAGVRAYTLERYRNHEFTSRRSFFQGDYLLPAQLNWSIQNRFKAVLLTFNEHNLWLAKFILRIANNQAVLLGARPSQQALETYSGFCALPEPVLIKGVKQTVLIKKLDPEFVFDSSLLRHKTHAIREMLL